MLRCTSRSPISPERRRSISERRSARDAVDQHFPVAIAEGSHPFPYRTRKLSPPAPMVLHCACGRVGRCRNSHSRLQVANAFKNPIPKGSGFFVRSNRYPARARGARAGWAISPSAVRFCRADSSRGASNRASDESAAGRARCGRT